MKALVKSLQVHFNGLDRAVISIEVPKAALSSLPDVTKPLEVEIRPKRKKRSLAANSYCWVLCGEIARKIGSGMRDTDVYKTAVRNAADDTMWTPARVPRAKAREMMRLWASNGEGWQAVPISNGYEPYVDFRLFQGSSVYDSRQMSRLIDELITEAENLGIDTLTPDERERMLHEWGQ